MTREELINKVSDRTSGTRSDPLSRDEVSVVVTATLSVLQEEKVLAHEVK